MDIHVINRTYHCGIWGYTGQHSGLGYAINPANIGLPETVPWQNVSLSVLKQLSCALILHMLAAVSSCLTFLSGIVGPKTYPDARANIMVVATGVISFALAMGAMAVDIALWLALYKAHSNLSVDGAWSSLGIAFWLTLAALAVLFVAAFPWQVVVVVIVAGCVFFVWILAKLVEVVWRSQPDWGRILEAEGRVFMQEFF